MYNEQDCTNHVHASACRERPNLSSALTTEPANSHAFGSYVSQHTAQICVWEL